MEGDGSTTGWDCCLPPRKKTTDLLLALATVWQRPFAQRTIFSSLLSPSCDECPFASFASTVGNHFSSLHFFDASLRIFFGDTTRIYRATQHVARKTNWEIYIEPIICSQQTPKNFMTLPVSVFTFSARIVRLAQSHHLQLYLYLTVPPCLCSKLSSLSKPFTSQREIARRVGKKFNDSP